MLRVKTLEFSQSRATLCGKKEKKKKKKKEKKKKTAKKGVTPRRCASVALSIWGGAN